MPEIATGGPDATETPINRQKVPLFRHKTRSSMSTATTTTQTETLAVAVPVATKTSYDQGTQTDAEPQPQQVSAAIETACVAGEIVPVPDAGISYSHFMPNAGDLSDEIQGMVSYAAMISERAKVNAKLSAYDPNLVGLGEGEMMDASRVPASGEAPKKRMFKPCVHNIRKDTCRICCPKRFCEHGRLRSTCVPCGGSQICIHKRQKNACPECDGAPGVCIHKKAKRTCKECSVANGTYVAPVRTRIHKSSNKDCEHGVRKTNCRICSKQTFCVHGRKKETCVPCGGKLVCEHKRQRNTCMSCVGAGICEHLKVRRKCQECLANQQGGAVIAPQQLEQIQGDVPRDVIMAEAGGVAV